MTYEFVQDDSVNSKVVKPLNRRIRKADVQW